jgi:hypothetical protein
MTEVPDFRGMQALNAWLVGHDHGLLLQGRSHLVHFRQSSSVFAAARTGHSAQAGIKRVEERGQPCATRAADREPPHHLANCRRRVLDRPADLLVADTGVIARRGAVVAHLLQRSKNHGVKPISDSTSRSARNA